MRFFEDFTLGNLIYTNFTRTHGHKAVDFFSDTLTNTYMPNVGKLIGRKFNDNYVFVLVRNYNKIFNLLGIIQLDLRFLFFIMIAP